MRWVFRLFGSLILLIVLFAGGVFLIPSQKVADLAAAQFLSLTGREMVIGGALAPSFYPVVGIVAKDVRVANAEWSDQPYMVSAGEIRVGVKFAALLVGRIEVTRLRLTDPVIVLERSANGQANWDIGTGSDTAMEPAADLGAVPITLTGARITGGQLLFVNHQSGMRIDVSDVSVSLGEVRSGSDAQLKGKGRVNGQRVTVDIRTSSPERAIAGRLVPLDLKIGGDFGLAAFRGEAALSATALEGQVDVVISDVNAAFAMIGLAQSNLPTGFLQSASVSGDLTVPNAENLHLRGGLIAIDTNRLTGAIDVTLGERMYVAADLKGDTLDLSMFQTEGDTADQTDGWSTDPIDASGLSAIDADVVLVANAVDLGFLKFGRTDIKARLRSGTLTVNLRDVEAYQGHLSGEIAARGGQGVAVNANVVASAVQLQPLLSDFAGTDRLLGTGDASLQLSSRGASLDDLMRGLNGSGRLDIGAGELKGFDLLGMLRNLDASYVGSGASTIFDSAKATITMSGGVLRNDDLSVLSPLFDASGTGEVDVGAQTIRYRISPRAFNKVGVTDAGGISVPVVISGPWSDLTYTPDLSALLNSDLEAVAKDIEAQIQDVVGDGLGDLLQDGDPGQSLEDQLGKQLELEAQKALESLLGGGTNQ